MSLQRKQPHYSDRKLTKNNVITHGSFQANIRASWFPRKAHIPGKNNTYCRFKVLNEEIQLPELHKTEKPYTIGRFCSNDLDEEKRQKAIKALLNKLTQGNFEQIFAKIIVIEYPTEKSLDGLVSQIFDKALSVPNLRSDAFFELYALLAQRLSTNTSLSDRMLPINLYNIRRALVTKCQTEFEFGQCVFSCKDFERLKEEGYYNDPDFGRLYQTMYKPVDANDVQTKHRALCNIRFIGYLYRHELISRKIIVLCLTSLLRDTDNPDPYHVEAMYYLCKTVGKKLENPRSTHKKVSLYNYSVQRFRTEVDSIMGKIQLLQQNINLECRLKFMCQVCFNSLMLDKIMEYFDLH
eukprot:gnl/MRDRNA2_/MRDRNA2_86209_c1_seq1.p1 gnl/MRDRNA2_/MRDRNA2_86209_c1~~gnl/MRDRNA2_/MRDRNA2_86209_c1_seq1.p1  ORF type:complete len:352 (+),score=-2.16 gnl/MRDRNA2_/MRDRNA2_86209_c1_seq1:261-1316(+)